MTFSVIILLWCRLRRHSCLFCKLFDHLIQNHRHYASSYAIDGSSMYFRPCICLLLSHFHGHMEPSSLTPFSSWRLFLPFHSSVLTHFAPFWGCSARYIMRQVSLASRWLSEHPTLYLSVLASKTLMNWFLLNFFWHVSNTIAQNAARLLVNIRKQRSSGHIFLSLAQVVSQPFFTFSFAKGRWGGTVTWAWGKVGYMVLGIWCEEAAFPSV